jgi:hypothetical protein
MRTTRDMMIGGWGSAMSDVETVLSPRKDFGGCSVICTSKIWSAICEDGVLMGQSQSPLFTASVFLLGGVIEQVSSIYFMHSLKALPWRLALLHRTPSPEGNCAHCARA